MLKTTTFIILAMHFIFNPTAFAYDSCRDLPEQLDNYFFAAKKSQDALYETYKSTSVVLMETSATLLMYRGLTLPKDSITKAEYGSIIDSSLNTQMEYRMLLDDLSNKGQDLKNWVKYCLNK